MVGVEEGQQDALQIDFRRKNSSWYLQLVAECFCIIFFFFGIFLLLVLSTGILVFVVFFFLLFEFSRIFVCNS